MVKFRKLMGYNRLRNIALFLLPPVAKRYIHFTKFFITGILNTTVDIVLFFVFANLIHVFPVYANILSTGLTMCLSFYLNYTFVFKSSNARHKAAALFILTTLFNAWVIQSAIIYSIVHSLGTTAFFTEHVWTLNLFAKFCGVGASFMLNFIGYRTIFISKEKNGT
jgi:putative flippase GtrA